MFPSDIEYIITEYIPPEQAYVYNKIHSNPKLDKASKDIIDEKAIEYAAKNGWIEGLNFFFERNLLNMDKTLSMASLGGDLPTIKWIAIRWGGVSDQALCCAAEGGHIPAMEWISFIGYIDETMNAGGWNNVLEYAARGGSVLAMQWLANRGATAWLEAFNTAASHGRVEAMEWLSLPPRNIHDWDTAFCNAAYCGSIPAMEWLVTKGARDWNPALCAAARAGHIPAMEWLAERGADDWNTALYMAALGGNISAMEWLIDHGANNLIMKSLGYKIINKSETYRLLQERIRMRESHRL